MKRFFYGMLGTWVVATSACLAAPEPAIVPAQGQWTVDVEFTHLQQIVLPTGGGSPAMRFWYTVITVTNNTGSDVHFYPKCDLMTDTFQIVPAGKFVSPAVFEQIKRRHKNTYPFLELLDAAGNKILQGEDNAKDIAVIWPDFDARAKNIKLFVTGLSNETAVVDHPVAKDQTGRPLKVFLKKTLELSYDLRGDPALRSRDSLAYEAKRWIMR